MCHKPLAVDYLGYGLPGHLGVELSGRSAIWLSQISAMLCRAACFHGPETAPCSLPPGTVLLGFFLMLMGGGQRGPALLLEPSGSLH